ncbi:hypothetical protein Tco_1526723 [Tanacetum coccineum]
MVVTLRRGLRGAFYRALDGPSTGPSTGPSRRRPGGFKEKDEGFKEKTGGLLRTQQRLDSVSVLGEDWRFPYGSHCE